MNIKKVSIILLFISNYFVFAEDYWIEANNGISGITISSVAINQFNFIYASNNGSGVWLSQNNGLNWEQINNGLDLNVTKLYVDQYNNYAKKRYRIQLYFICFIHDLYCNRLRIFEKHVVSFYQQKKRLFQQLIHSLSSKSCTSVA